MGLTKEVTLNLPGISTECMVVANDPTVKVRMIAGIPSKWGEQLVESRTMGTERIVWVD